MEKPTKKHFFTLMSSYLCIILTCMGAFTILYVNQLRRAGLEQSRSDLRADANRIVGQINRQLASMTEMSGTLYGLRWVQYMSLGSSRISAEIDPIKRMDIVNEFDAYMRGDGFYDHVALIFPQQGTVVSRLGWYDMEEYFLRIGDVQSGGRLLNSVHTPCQFQILYPNELTLYPSQPGSPKREAFWLAHTLDNAGGSPRVQLAFVFYKRDLAEYLNELMPKDLLRLTVMDASGTSLVSVDYSGATTNERLFELTVPCTQFGWRIGYAYEQPAFRILPEDFSSLLTWLLVSAILSPLLAYAAAWITYRPIGRLVSKLRISGAGVHIQKRGTEISLIEQYMDVLEEDNHILQQKIGAIHDYAQRDFIRGLIQGYFGGRFETEAARFSLFYTEETNFCVFFILLQDGGKSEEENIKILLQMECSFSGSPCDFKFLPSYEGSALALLSDQTGFLTNQEAASMAELLSRKLQEESGVPLELFVGLVKQGATGPSLSYQSARSKAILGGSSLRAGFKEDTVALDAFYYPTSWEIQLINNLKAGRMETVWRILDEMQVENCKRQLTRPACSLLFRTLFGTLRRVAAELDLESSGSSWEPDTEALYGDAFLEAEEREWERMRDCCAQIGERGAAVCETVVQNRFVDYVSEHLYEPDLSLKKLGDYFSTSVSTISQGFKAATGLNFVDFICRMRVEKAKEMLKDARVSIKEVGVQVGYENEYSFRRAFLRHEGVSPSDFRKIAQAEK